MLTFLYVELEAATIFTGLAFTPQRPSNTTACVSHARRAYDTVRRFAGRIPLEEADHETVVKGLENVRSRLQELGEIFEAPRRGLAPVDLHEEGHGDPDLIRDVQRFLFWCGLVRAETHRMLLQNRILMSRAPRAVPHLAAQDTVLQKIEASKGRCS